MRLLSAAAGLMAALALGGRACAGEPWADARYSNRAAFVLSNASTHAFAAGDVIAATLPAAPIAGRIRADGADAAVYRFGAAIPCRALVMGGSVKVLLPLQADLPAGGIQTGYALYFGALEDVPRPDPPSGLVIYDFSDGQRHGWQSLQDPAGSADVRMGQDGAFGPVLVMDNSRYHHPIAYAAEMAPVGPATTYTKLRTGGGENEAASFQRFNTQTLLDLYDTEYLTGSSVAGAGLAVDSYGSQEMAITVKLSGPEGSDQRIHPGPDALDPGLPYSAATDNFQYIVTATQDIAGRTTILGDAWQAPTATPGGAGDPAPAGFKIGRATVNSESHQPLNAGVVGIMSYYSTLLLHWVVVVPNPWAEYVTTQMDAVEDSPGPGPGKAIVKGTVYYGPDGLARPMGGVPLQVKDAGGRLLVSGVSDAAGAFRFIVEAAAAARTLTASVSGSGMAGSADVSVTENATFVADVPVTFTASVAGQVVDANGQPVAGATVGRWLDGFPFVTTGADGRYTLPVPSGAAVVGAHKDGALVSGPRWLLGAAERTSAPFTLFPANPGLLDGVAPDISPAALTGANPAAATDGSLTTFWQSGAMDGVSAQNPLRLAWTLNAETVSEVDVHWKRFPAAWRLEMTNSAGTRVYYTAGEDAPAETGGYLAPGTTDRHVVAVKTAPVADVTEIAIVVTRASGADPLSLDEVAARPPLAVGPADAVQAMRIAAGIIPAPADPNAVYRWNAWNEDAVIDARDAVELAKDLGREVKPLRVLVINYQPVIESQGNKLVRQVFWWNNPYTNTEAHRKDLELASHDYLRIALLPQIEVDEYPLFGDGTRYTDEEYLADTYAHSWNRGGIDYNAIISEFDLVRRVDCGDVDEIWVQAVPGFGMWETTMAGPGAYWCNSGPVGGTNGNRLFIITGFNYERANDVMLEDWGHRSESILGGKVYGGWNSASERTTWDRFTRYDKITPGRASCGNVHFPPNGTSDYDYGNTTYVSSDADDWLNYPNLTGARTTLNRSAWAAPFAGDYHRNYHIWWFSRFPHVPGLGPDGYQANWWKYVVDMNAYAESR